MKQTPMPNSVTVLALSLSIVALLLSAYAALGVSNLSGLGVGGSFEGKNFEQAVETEINKFIQNEQARAQGGAAPTPTEPVEVDLEDDPVKGDPDAPITIVEFSDYQCPFCQRFAANTLPQLTEEYIDTGIAKLVYKDFPLGNHPAARPAAIAAECAQELSGDEAYYAFHDQLFENQTNLNEQTYNQIAANLGLDANAFSECLADPVMGEEVDQDFLQGQSIGVRGTPAFFVNGQLLSGAQPFEAFQAVIEAELEN